jgi:hypothetical protein
MVTSDALPEVQGNQERWSLATRLLLPAVAAARQHVGISEQVFRTLPRDLTTFAAEVTEMPTDNPTKNQHFYSQAEQRLNADASGSHIYAFRLLDREKMVVEAPKRPVPISRNLAFDDLFTLDVKGTLRTNLEQSFERFERRVAEHSKTIIDVLRNRDDAGLKDPLIGVFQAKLSNMARNPFSVKKGLSTFEEILKPEYDYIFGTEVPPGVQPHREKVCERFRLTPDEYDRWLRLLVRLHHPINPPFTVLEHVVADLLKKYRTEVNVHELSPESGADACLLLDRSVVTDQPPGMLLFEFNLCSSAFVTVVFVDIEAQFQSDVLPRAREAGLAANQGQVAVHHHRDDLAALRLFNSRAIYQCAEHVYSASARMPTLPPG